MSTDSIIKHFPEIGTIEYKVASSRRERESAYALVYDEYLLRGFILPRYYKSGLRVTMHNIVRGTVTFIGIKDGDVVATVTLIPDSPLGLPLDQAYKNEADKLRAQGRRICEVGQLAIKSSLFGRGLFSMFNFNKLDFLFTLFKLVFQYALFYRPFDDICIVTNPKYMIFKFLPFETIGPTAYYGYDRIAVKKKAAVCKRLAFDTIKDAIAHRSSLRGKMLALYRMFLNDRVPSDIFSRHREFTPADIRYFFEEKSDTLNRIPGGLHGVLREWYDLEEETVNTAGE